MTKWVCNNKRCGGTDPCRVELAPWFAPPENCLYSAGSACWKRDCTTEEKKDELPEGIDWRMTTHYNVKRINDLEKKVQELIASGQGQMTRIQELEQMLQNHIHYIAGTTGKSAWREK